MGQHDALRRRALVAALVIGVCVVVAGVVAVLATRDTSQRQPRLQRRQASGGCPLRSGSMAPADFYTRADVSDLPTLDVDWVARAVELDRGDDYGVRRGELRPIVSNQGPGGLTSVTGDHIGFPINVVDGRHARVQFTRDVNVLSADFLTGRTGNFVAYGAFAEPGDYPSPATLKIQGFPGPPIWDHYLLTVDSHQCMLYEQIGVRGVLPYDPVNQRLYPPYSADGGMIWDLRRIEPRARDGQPQGVTASREPLAPLVIGFAETKRAAEGGRPIDHAVHWYGVACRGGHRRPGKAFVWPARATDCHEHVDDHAAPYGAWFRLRADYPTDGLTPQARAVVQALQTHGLILGDGGSQGYAMESAPCPDLDDDPDECWTASTISQLERIDVADLEALDTSGLRADPTAGTNDADYWIINR